MLDHARVWADLLLLNIFSKYLCNGPLFTTGDSKIDRTISLSCMSFEILQSSIQYAGLLGRWATRLIDQVSHVPSFFFIIYYRLWALKTLYTYFYKVIKKIERIFAKNFARDYKKK